MIDINISLANFHGADIVVVDREKAVDECRVRGVLFEAELDQYRLSLIEEGAAVVVKSEEASAIIAGDAVEVVVIEKWLGDVVRLAHIGLALALRMLEMDGARRFDTVLGAERSKAVVQLLAPRNHVAPSSGVRIVGESDGRKAVAAVGERNRNNAIGALEFAAAHFGLLTTARGNRAHARRPAQELGVAKVDVGQIDIEDFLALQPRHEVDHSSRVVFERHRRALPR